MSATPKTGPSHGDYASGTLGDLVYSNKAKARVSEEDWFAILQSVAVGDRLALRALYDRTHRIAFTVAVRVLDNRESAEEVTLDVFHQVWREGARYDRAAGSVLGWITGLARSKATNRLRFEQRKKDALSGASLRHEAPFSAAAASHRAEALKRTVRAHFLQRALTTLAPEERQAIESALFSELTYADIAARLGKPVGTVRTRIRYGLARLRMALATSDTAP